MEVNPKFMWVGKEMHDLYAIYAEIESATAGIKEALWSIPADLDLAKLLVSKRMGLRICLGEVKVKLKKPVVRIVENMEIGA